MSSIPDWGERFMYTVLQTYCASLDYISVYEIKRLLPTSFLVDRLLFHRGSLPREMMKRKRKNFRYTNLQCWLTHVKFPISNHDIARIASVSAGKVWPQLKYRFTPWFTCRYVIINFALGAINTPSSYDTFSSRPLTSSDNQAISAKSNGFTKTDQYRINYIIRL